MARRLIIALSLCPLPVLAAGISFDETRIAELRYGLVCGSDTAETMPAPDTSSGTIKRRQDWQKIVLETQVIPMIKGMALGVDIKPQAPRAIGNVQITVTHPPFLGSDLTSDSWTASFDGNGSNLNFFELEHPYELVEGQWTIEARKGLRALYSVTFQVVPPEVVPDMAKLCDGISLTS